MTKHPMELARGDVIAEHPTDRTRGEWPVAGPAVRFGDIAEIPCVTSTGSEWLVAGVHDELTLVTTPRQEVIAGLRALADFLEQHPDLPVSPFQDIHYWASTARALGDAVTEVNRAAAILGAPARRRNARTRSYIARREFGPIAYEAVAFNVYPEVP